MLNFSNGVRNVGYEVSAGIRQQLTDSLEGNVGLHYVNVEDLDIDETSLSLGGRFYFAESLSAGVDYHSAEDDDFFKSSVRMDFL